MKKKNQPATDEPVMILTFGIYFNKKKKVYKLTWTLCYLELGDQRLQVFKPPQFQQIPLLLGHGARERKLSFVHNNVLNGPSFTARLIKTF